MVKNMPDNKENEKVVFKGKTEFISKCIVIGDPAVGKTSILKKYTTHQFQEKYLPTVGVNIVKESIKLEGEDATVNVMFWDIAGQPQFYMIFKPYFKGADVILLVFDVTRSSTFSNIKNWYKTATKYGLSSVPRILVANKIDLKDERKIILPMIKHRADELNCPYLETSALTGENIELLFKNVAEMIYKSKFGL